MSATHFVHPTAANARTATHGQPAHAYRAPVPAASPRQVRERDFGVGYGNTSGYAPHRRYSSNWAQPRFTFA